MFSIVCFAFQLLTMHSPVSGKLIQCELDIQDKIKLGSYPYGTTSDILQEPSPTASFVLAKLSKYRVVFSQIMRPEN